MADVSTEAAQEIYAAASHHFVHYYLSFAQEHRLDSTAQAEEMGNFQAALSLCKQNRWWATFGHLLEAIRYVVLERGYWAEYRRWLELVLQQPLACDQTLYLTLLDDYAGLLHTQGQAEVAIQIYQEILETAEQALTKAYAHYGLGHAYFAAGERWKAAEQWELANELAGQSGQPGTVAITNYFLNSVRGEAAPLVSLEIMEGESFPKAHTWKRYFKEQFRARRYFDRRELIKAQESYAVVCNLAKELSDQDGLALALFHLGEIARMMGDASLALRYYHDSEQIAQRLDNHIGLVNVYEGIARVQLGLHRYDLARPYLEECVRLERQFSAGEALAERLFMLGYARANTKNIGGAKACFREAKELFAQVAPERAAKVEQALNRLNSVADKE